MEETSKQNSINQPPDNQNQSDTRGVGATALSAPDNSANPNVRSEPVNFQQNKEGSGLKPEAATNQTQVVANVNNTSQANYPNTEAKEKSGVNKHAENDSKFRRLIKPLYSFEDPKRSLASWGILIVLILTLIFVSYTLLFITGIDKQLFSVTLEGTVTDESGVAIDSAALTINEDTTTTSTTGYFRFSGLETGITQIQIQADGFSDLSQEIDVDRGFLSYSQTQNFVLAESVTATLTGSFEASDEDYDFLGDNLFIGEKEYEIQRDGTFEINLTETGQQSFVFESPNFIDISRSIEIVSGENTIEPIELTIAGDISGELKSYVSEEPLENVLFEIENVDGSQIITDLEAETFLIKDLEVGRTYDMRVFATGYDTKDYTVTIEQGENKIFDLAFVEQFEVAFYKEDEEERQEQFAFSRLDGADQARIELDYGGLRLDPISTYYSPSEERIYFLSDHERARGVFGTVALPYYITKSSTAPIALFEFSDADKDLIGTLIPNFIAKKMINITEEEQASATKRIEIMDLNGSNKQVVRETEGTIQQTFLSDAGTSLYTLEERSLDGTNETVAQIILTDTNSGDSTTVATKENMNILDVSSDGTRVIFVANESDTAFTDLLLFDSNSSQTKVLITNEKGNEYQFVEESNEFIVFWEERNGRTNIFGFTISANNTEQLTNLGPTDKINRIYMQGEFMFYITEEGLYTLNPYSPASYKIVDEGVFQWN